MTSLHRLRRECGEQRRELGIELDVAEADRVVLIDERLSVWNRRAECA